MSSQTYLRDVPHVYLFLSSSATHFDTNELLGCFQYNNIMRPIFNPAYYDIFYGFRGGVIKLHYSREVLI